MNDDELERIKRKRLEEMQRRLLLKELQEKEEEPKEEKEELGEMIQEKYGHLREALEKKEEMMAGKVTAGEEKIKGVASDIDSRFRDNPWPYLLGTAAVAFTIGALLESKHSK